MAVPKNELYEYRKIHEAADSTTVAEDVFIMTF